jgi:hypothetical protein
MLVRVWKKLLPHAEGALEEVGLYLILAASLVCMYFVTLGMIAIGITSEITTPIHWMEVGAHLCIFASFFWRIAIRALRGIGT